MYVHLMASRMRVALLTWWPNESWNLSFSWCQAFLQSNSRHRLTREPEHRALASKAQCSGNRRRGSQGV